MEQKFEKEGTKEIERIRGVYFQALKSIENKISVKSNKVMDWFFRDFSSLNVIKNI